MLSTIDEVFDYIYSFINLENKIETRHRNKEYSLDNMFRVAKLFGNPHENLNIIHLAGTKGKGSTSLMLTSLLKRAGFSVLTFLSPHLIKPNERILKDGVPISDQQLMELVNFIKETLEQSSVVPTTFELLFLIALLYGKKENCTYYILETGLGGRFDCTNIVTPLVSVITSIGYDHMNILGDTIEQIASEKAGIIKEKCPVVVAGQEYEVVNVFKEKARSLMADFYYIPEQLQTKGTVLNARGCDFTIELPEKAGLPVRLPLFGEHQRDNFSTALYAALLVEPSIETLLRDEMEVDVKLPGRIELIRQDPPIILDVSHTAESARKLIETLEDHFPGVKWQLFSSMADDKNVTGFYKILAEKAENLVMTPLSKYKISDTEAIFKKVKSYFPASEYTSNFEEAAAGLIDSGKPLLVTGSFYIAGPFLEFYRRSVRGKMIIKNL